MSALERLCPRSGQAMVEFVVIAGMMLATVAIMMVFLGTFREYGTRVLDLVGSEYP
ncbi:MAG: hypothetical protein WCG36_03620 [bacterium]